MIKSAINKRESKKYERVLLKVSKEPAFVFDAKNPYQGDEVLLKKAINLNSSLLENLVNQSDSGPWGEWKWILKDKNWMLEVIEQGGPEGIKWIDESLKNDEQIAAMVVEKYPAWFDMLGSVFLEDKDWFIRALKNAGGLSVRKFVEKMDVEVLENEEVKELLIEKDPAMLGHPKLKPWLSNEQWIKKALTISPYAIRHIKEPWNDREEILLLGEPKYILQVASERLKSNREFVKKCIQKRGENLAHAAKELQDDEELVMLTVQKVGVFLIYASERLRSNPRVVLEAVKVHRWAKKYATKELIDKNESIQKQTGLDFEGALRHQLAQEQGERERVELDCSLVNEEKESIRRRKVQRI